MAVSLKEDKVLREMDVFVTDRPNLYLMQFPLRPSNAPEISICDAKFKPRHKILELNCNHAAKMNRNGNDDLLKLSSTVVPTNSISLGVGVMNHDGLHISPIQDVLQLRPVFKNIPNHVLMNNKDNKDNDDEGHVLDMDGINAGAGAAINSPQAVLLKKKESDRAASARTQSYSHLAAQEEMEHFIKLDTYNINDSQFEFDNFYYDKSSDTETGTGGSNIVNIDNENSGSDDFETMDMDIEN